MIVALCAGRVEQHLNFSRVTPSRNRREIKAPVRYGCYAGCLGRESRGRRSGEDRVRGPWMSLFTWGCRLL